MDWNPPADLTYSAKLDVIRSYLEQMPRPRTMIETGLYAGNGSGMQMGVLLDTYIALDIDPEQVASAQARGYTAVAGDSADTLAGVLATVSGPALFWLDAHLVSEYDEENASSLMGELDAILAWPHHATSVVLIDDLRMCGRQGWPTVQEIRDKVGDIWQREEAADIMRLTPRA